MRLMGIGLSRWRWMHRWSSLACTAFLLLSCLSGLPLIFTDEIAALTAPPVRLRGPALVVAPVNLDALAQASVKRYPAERVRFIFFDKDEGYIKVVMGPEDTPDRSRDHPLVFDAASGYLLDEPPSMDRRRSEFMPFVTRLHTDLLSGFAGEMVLAVAGFLTLVAIVSGVVLYGPYMKQLAFGVLRGERHRAWWLDLHNLLGIVTVVWLLVVAATGVVNEFAKPLSSVWRTGEMARLASSAEKSQHPRASTSLQSAYESAKAVLPASNVTSVILPSLSFNNPGHYLVWTNGNTPLTHRLFSAILVDADNGSIAAVANMPVYLRMLQLSRPLHFGDYGGLPLKFIWAIFDVMAIAILLSGLYLWLQRFKRR